MSGNLFRNKLALESIGTMGPRDILGLGPGTRDDNDGGGINPPPQRQILYPSERAPSRKFLYCAFCLSMPSFWTICTHSSAAWSSACWEVSSPATAREILRPRASAYSGTPSQNICG